MKHKVSWTTETPKALHNSKMWVVQLLASQQPIKWETRSNYKIFIPYTK